MEKNYKLNITAAGLETGGRQIEMSWADKRIRERDKVSNERGIGGSNG